jgi:arabinose-5-phosphate isomerase
MTAAQTILESAKRTVQLEAQAVTALQDRLNGDFANVALHILSSKGRVVVSGIGKSAIIANKLVATLNSTGTPSLFLHAADAIHGDLGMIQCDDTVIIISNSGNTPEIKVLASLIKAGGNMLVAITGNLSSELAQNARYILNSSVEQEACPHNLAPTSSTTVQLVLGDALAVALLEARGFTKEDFARFHPGGALGKQLYLRLDDLYQRNPKPVVAPDAKVPQVILEISSNRMGAAAVVEDNRLAGIITDGDLRRMMQQQSDFTHLKASDIMSSNPKTALGEMMAVDALQLMKQHNITQLVVTSEKHEFLGFVHLHDLLREGILG